MKNSLLKLISIILITLFVIAIIPMAVMAANTDGVILEKTNGEKIIYIKGMDQTEFKYAFSNNESRLLVQHISQLQKIQMVNV